MKPLYDPLVVLSVYRRGVTTQVNNWAHESTLKILEAEGIPFGVAEGFYKGTTEQAIIVNGRYLKRALEIAADHAQESVLYIHSDRFTELLEPSTGTVIQKLGQLREGKESELNTYEAYTRTQDGRIWVAGGQL